MEELIKKQIDPDGLPSHIAVIMDGNGRWAKQNNRPRIFGHKNGVKSVREITEAAAEIGIEYLTLYAFSTENWQRPKLEVNALMNLLVETIGKELSTLMDNDIRLNSIGDITKLPTRTHRALTDVIERTSNNKRMTLTLALNYSSRWEITEAVKQIANEVAQGTLDVNDINDAVISNHLTTADMPDPELLIRTSGEKRVSNFLMWQLSYTEFHFTDVYWPDFRKANFYQALLDYQNRERRFGKTGEQVK